MDVLLQEFDVHLLAARGASLSTRREYGRYVREFLNGDWRSTRPDITKLSARDLIEFTTERSKRCSPGTAQLAATALRSFLRFLHVRGLCGARLVAAVPTIDQVDLNTGVVTVTETKFHKSRLVPLHPTTTRALRRYARKRDRYYHRPFSSSAFFLTERGTSLKYWRALMAFSELRARLGWAGRRGQRPRLHDLRHAFAVRNLIRWYRRGIDLDQRIAALSTYLGHVKVTDTYWYFTAVPELLAITGRRYESYAQRNGDPAP